MALYALGDLHLSFQADKSMDQFGKVWRHHERKIEKYVRQVVKPEDTLVLTGEDNDGVACFYVYLIHCYDTSN